MGIFSKKKAEVKKIYDFHEQLGTGNFAIVYRCTLKPDFAPKKDSTGRTIEGRQYEAEVDRLESAGGGTQKIQIYVPAVVAIKSIEKAKVEDMNDITREIEIMQRVNHPNIISLYEVFDEAKFMHLVMELVTGGELFDRIVEAGSYTEKDAATTISTLCSALDHLHQKKIVHRDLKPENILYSSKAPDAVIKVADFGLARMVNQGDIMKTACGTPGYVAPEILKNTGYDSSAVDLWATGVILYILLCGFPPFYEEELPALFDSILKARYDFPSPWWDNISDGAKSLVKKLLNLDAEKRYTAAQVQNDDWVKNAEDKDISGASKQLKKYNASRKLRKAALGIIAQQKMAKALKELQGGGSS